MKNLKKVLALVMAFAMAFTMMAGAAYTDQDDIQATDAVELLNTLNVMTGKGDGMFHPNDTITRAEICRIIYTIRNEGNDNANAYADMQTSFQDLTSADDWAKGYIKHCQSVNLISGRDEAGTIFGPQDPVTGVELAVICLRVLGYDPAKAGIGGESWSTKTIGLASEAGLLKGVNMESVTGPCERQWAAQIMANMIDARTVRWSTDGDRYTNVGEDNTPNKTVGREYMKLHTTVGTLTSVSGSNLDVVCNTSDIADSDGALEKNFTNVKTDYSELLGQKVKVLYSDGKANSVIGVYALTGNTVYTVNASAVESDGDNKVKFDGKSYSIEYINTSTDNNGVTSTERENGLIRVLYVGINGNESTDGAFTPQHGVWGDNNANKAYKPSVPKTWKNGSGTYFDAEDIFDDWNSSSAIMTFVDSDDNGRLDSVIITDYAAAEVTSATSTKLVAGASYNFSDENIDEGLAQGDWVSISYNRFDDCKDIKKIDVTSGKLDSLKKDSKPEHDKYYSFNEYRVDNVWFNDSNNANADIKSVKAGDTIDYVLLNGVAWKVKRSGAGSLDNVVDVAMVVKTDGAGLSGNQAKLQFFNDTTAVVDVDTYTATNGRVPFANLQAGKLYEYSVSGGKYIFEKLSTEKDFYGDYTYAGLATYSISDKEKISGKTIDDSAKVIVFDGNDSDIITGKQLKNLAASTINTSANNAEYFTADVSGLNRAAAMTLKVTKLPQDLITNDHYGYILSDAVLSSGNNEISYDLLLESGEKFPVSEKSTKVADRKANTLIGYKTLAAEDSNGKRYIDDVTLYTLGNGESKNFGIGAVTSVNNNQSAIEIWGYGKAEGWHAVNRDIPSDTVIFYVDTKDKEGSTTGTVRTAINWTSDLDKNANDFVAVTNIPGEDKTKVANCLYLCKDGSDMEVLVIADSDRMLRGKEVDNYHELQNPALTTNTDAPKAGDAVTFTLDIADVKVAGTAEITVTDANGNQVHTDSTAVAAGANSVQFSFTPSKAGSYTATVKVEDANGSLQKSGTRTIDVDSKTITAANLSSTALAGSWPSAGDAWSAADALTVASVANTTSAVTVKNNNNTFADGDTVAAGDLVVTITWIAADAYTFANGEAAEDKVQITAPNPQDGIAPSAPVVSDDNKTITVTYTVPIARKLSADSPNAINNALAAENATVEVTSGTLTSDLTVPEGSTLVIGGTTIVNDFTKIKTTNGGTVLLKQNATLPGGDAEAKMNALGDMAAADAKKTITTAPAADAEPVVLDTTKSLKIKGEGDAVLNGFSSETVADMLADTNSEYLTPVKITLDKALVASKKIKAERDFGTGWEAMNGVLGTGFTNDTNDFVLNGLFGNKIKAIKIIVDPDGTPTEYVFTIK